MGFILSFLAFAVYITCVSSSSFRKVVNGEVQASRFRRSLEANLRENGANVCEFKETVTAYQTVKSTVQEVQNKEVCCRKFIGCWKKCKKPSFKTKVVTKKVSFFVTRNVRHCCNGWLVNDEGTECTRPSCFPPCQHGGVCKSRDTCECPSGFQGSICQQNVNECEDGAEGDIKCQNSTGSVCNDIPGSYYCSCKKGFKPNIFDSSVCSDVNECDVFPCKCAPGSSSKCQASCLNTIGSYQCSCSTGYQLSLDDKNLCVDVNECLTGQNSCQQKCVNTDGGYHCTCFEGFEWSATKKQCIQVNQCVNKGGCEMTCVPIIGNYLCRCSNGYSLASDLHRCIDINECTISSPCDLATSTCKNYAGGYYCACKPGYRIAYNNLLCIDVDECSGETSLCQQQCTNTVGSYSCSCNKGYKLNPDGRTCKDINECKNSENQICSQKCVNTEGSYECQCEPGYTLSADKRACIVGSCKPAKEPLYGLMTCDGQTIGRKCHFTCSPGFSLQGSAERTCQSNRLWSGTEAKCLPDQCRQPTPPGNGKLILPCDLSFGSTCPVQCLDGFILRGQEFIKCGFIYNQLKWSLMNVRCEKIVVCNPNPCRNGGKCSIVTDKEYKCNCTNTGYTGINCDLLKVIVDPIPKIAVDTISSNLKIFSKPSDSVTVEMYPENSSIEILPYNVTLTKIKREQMYQLKSSITGLTWIQYRLIADGGRVSPLRERLAFFYNDKNLVSLPGNSLLTLDNNCYKLDVEPHSCPSNLLKLSSTAEWNIKGNGLFTTTGVVFVNVGIAHFPLLLTKVKVEDFVQDLVAESTLSTSPPIPSQNCKKRHLSNQELQYTIKNDLFVKDFLKEFSKISPSWFSLELDGDLRYIHKDNIRTFIWTGKRVNKEESCNGAAIDESALFIVYLHHESLTIKVLGKSITMTTKTKFCLLVDICNYEPHIVFPKDNYGKLESLFSFAEVTLLGWKISLKSVGFRSNKNTKNEIIDARKCAKLDTRQIAFGSVAMSYKHDSSVSGEIHGNLFYDIMKDGNGDDVVVCKSQCFDGKSRFDTNTWYTADTPQKKYVKQKTPHNMINTQTNELASNRHLLRIRQGNHSVFKVKTGLKPILIKSTSSSAHLDFQYKESSGLKSVSAKVDSSAIEMLEFPLHDLKQRLETLTTDKQPLNIKVGSFLSYVTGWNTNMARDITDILHGKLVDKSLLTAINYHYSMLNKAITKLTSIITDITADSTLSGKASNFKIILTDLKKILPDLEKFAVVKGGSRELEHVALNFMGSVCLFPPCIENVNITLHPISQDIGWGALCRNPNQRNFDVWQTEAVVGTAQQKGQFFNFAKGDKMQLCLSRNGVETAKINTTITLFNSTYREIFTLDDKQMKIPEKSVDLFGRYSFNVNSTVSFALRNWNTVSIQSYGASSANSKIIKDLQDTLNKLFLNKSIKLDERLNKTNLTYMEVQRKIKAYTQEEYKQRQKVKEREDDVVKAVKEKEDALKLKNIWESKYSTNRVEIAKIEKEMEKNCTQQTCNSKCHKLKTCTMCQDPIIVNVTVPSCKKVVEDHSYGFLQSEKETCSHIVTEYNMKYTGNCKDTGVHAGYAKSVMERLRKKQEQNISLTLEDAYDLEAIDPKEGRILREAIQKQEFMKNIPMRLANNLLTDKDFERLAKIINKTYANKLKQDMKKIHEATVVTRLVKKLDAGQTLTERDYAKLKEINPQTEKKIRRTEAVRDIQRSISLKGSVTQEEIEELRKYAPEYAQNLTESIERGQRSKLLIENFIKKLGNGSLTKDDLAELEKVNPQAAKKLKAVLKEQLKGRVKEMEEKLNSVKNVMSEKLNNTDFKNMREQLNKLSGKIKVYDIKELRILQETIRANDKTNGSLYEEVFERLELDYQIKTLTGNSNDLLDVLQHFFAVLTQFDISHILQRSPDGALKGLLDVQGWFKMAARAVSQACEACQRNCTQDIALLSALKQLRKNLLAFKKSTCEGSWEIGFRTATIDLICVDVMNTIGAIDGSQKNCTRIQLEIVRGLENITDKWKGVRGNIENAHKNQWKTNKVVTKIFAEFRRFITKIIDAFANEIGSSKIPFISKEDVIIETQKLLANKNATVSNVQIEILIVSLKDIFVNIEKLPSFIQQNKQINIQVSSEESQNITGIFNQLVDHPAQLLNNLCVDRKPNLNSLSSLTEGIKRQFGLVISSNNIQQLKASTQRFVEFSSNFILAVTNALSSLENCKLKQDATDSSKGKQFENKAMESLREFLSNNIPLKIKSISDIANEIQDLIGEYSLSGLQSPVGELLGLVSNFIEQSPEFNIPMMFSLSPKTSAVTITSFEEYLISLSTLFEGMDDILQNCTRKCDPGEVFGKSSLNELTNQLDTYLKPISKVTIRYAEDVKIVPKGLQVLTSGLEEVRTALQSFYRSGTAFDNGEGDGFKDVINAFKNTIDGAKLVKKNLVKAYESLNGLKNPKVKVFYQTLNDVKNKLADLYQISDNKLDYLKTLIENVERFLRNLQQNSSTIDSIKKSPIQRQLEMAEEAATVVQGVSKVISEIYSSGVDQNAINYIDTVFVPSIINQLKDVKNFSQELLDGAQKKVIGMGVNVIDLDTSLNVDIGNTLNDIIKAAGKHKSQLANKLSEMTKTFKTKIKNAADKVGKYFSNFAGTISKYKSLKEELQKRLEKFGKLVDDVENTIKELKGKQLSKIGEIKDATDELIESFKNYDLAKILIADQRVIPGKIKEIKNLFTMTSTAFQDIDMIFRKCESCKIEKVFGYRYLKQTAMKLNGIFKTMFTKVERLVQRFGDAGVELSEVKNSVKSMKRKFDVIVNNGRFSTDTLKLLSQGLKDSTTYIGSIQSHFESIGKILLDRDVDLELIGGSINKMLNTLSGAMNKSYEITTKGQTIYGKIRNMTVIFEKIKDRSSGLNKGPLGSRLDIAKILSSEAKDLLAELPKLFGLSNAVLEAAGLDTKWLNGFGNGLITLTKTTSGLLDRTGKVLEATDITLLGIEEIKEKLSNVDTVFESLTNAPWDKKIPKLTNVVKSLIEVYDNTIETTVKGANTLDISLTKDGLKSSIVDSFGKDRVESYKNLCNEISAMMTKLQAGPITEIGKLTDTVDDFIEAMEGYDIGKMLLSNPGDLKSKFTEFRQLAFSTGDIIRSISDITGSCRTCNVSSVFGKGFMSSVTKKVANKFSSIQDVFEGIGERVDAGLTGWVKIVNVSEKITGNFKGITKDGFTEQTFDDLSEALSISSEQIGEITEGSEDIFKILFNGNNDMDTIQQKFESLVHTVSFVFNKSAVILPKVGDVYGSVKEVEKQFTTIKDAVDSVQEGPTEARIKTLKTMTNGIRGIGKTLPLIFNQSSSVLIELGINSSWFRKFSGKLADISEEITKVMNLTDNVLNAAGVVVENANGIQNYARSIRSDYEKILKAPWSQKFNILNNALDKAEKIYGNVENIGDTIQKSIKEVTGIDVKIGDGLLAITSNTTGVLGHIKNAVKTVRSISKDIATTITQIKSGPVEKIGKLKDSTNKFVDKLKEYDIAQILVLAPKFAKGKVSEIKNIIVESGKILQNITMLIKKYNCSFCDVDKIFGKGFSNGIVDKISNGLQNMTEKIEGFINTVQRGAENAAVIINSVKGIQGEVNKLKGVDFSKEGFTTVAQVLQKSSDYVEDIKNGSSNIFKMLFNEDKEILELTGKFESFVSKVGHYLEKAGNFSENVAEALGKVNDIKSKFIKTVENFDKLTTGPLENRVEAVKNIADGLNSIMKVVPDFLKNSKISPGWLKDLGGKLENVTSGISTVLNKTSEIASETIKGIENVHDVIGYAKKINNGFKDIFSRGSIDDKLIASKNLISNVKKLTESVNKVLESVNTVFKRATDKTIFKSTTLFGNGTVGFLNSISDGITTIADRYSKFTELSKSLKNAFDLIEEDPAKFALEELPKIFKQASSFAKLLYKDVKNVAKKLNIDIDQYKRDNNVIRTAKKFNDFANATISAIGNGYQLINDFRTLFNSKDFKSAVTNLDNLMESGDKFLKSMDKFGGLVFDDWGKIKEKLEKSLGKVSDFLGVDLKNIGNVLKSGLEIGGHFVDIYGNLKTLFNLKEFNIRTVITAGESLINIAKSGAEVAKLFGFIDGTKGLEEFNSALGGVSSVLGALKTIAQFVDWINSACDVTYEQQEISREIFYPCFVQRLQIENVKVAVEMCSKFNKTVSRGYGEAKLCCTQDECIHMEDTRCLQYNENCVNSQILYAQKLSGVRTELLEIIENYRNYSKGFRMKAMDMEHAKVLLKNQSFHLERVKAAILVNNQILNNSAKAMRQIKEERDQLIYMLSGNISNKIKIQFKKVEFQVTKYSTQISQLPLRITYVDIDNGKEHILELSFEFNKQEESLTDVARHIMKKHSSIISRNRRSVHQKLNIHESSTKWTNTCADFQETFELLNAIIHNLRDQLTQVSSDHSNEKTRTTNSDTEWEKQLRLLDVIDDTNSQSIDTIKTALSRWINTATAVLSTESLGSPCSGLEDCLDAQFDSLLSMLAPYMKDYDSAVSNIKNMKLYLMKIVNDQNSISQAEVIKIKNKLLSLLKQVNSHVHICDEHPYLKKLMPNSVAAYKGELFELKCTLDGPSSMEYVWKQNDLVIPEQKKWKLVLISVSETDQGNYTCHGHTLTSNISSNPVLVRVLEPMKFLQQAQDKLLEYPGGNEVQFVCNTTNNTLWRYKWWYRPYSSNSSMVISSKKVFNIKAVRTSNTGEYWCEITDGYNSLKSRKSKVDIVRMMERKEAAKIFLSITTSKTEVDCELPETKSSSEVSAVLEAALKAENGLAKFNSSLKVYYANHLGGDKAKLTLDIGVTNSINSGRTSDIDLAFKHASSRVALGENVNKFVEDVRKREGGLTVPWKRNCSLTISAMKVAVQWQNKELACPYGMEASKEQLKCVQCTPGTFDSGRGSCTACPMGTYQPRAAESHCIPCGGGMLTEETGATIHQQCVLSDFVCKEPFNLILLLDSSQNVTQKRWHQLTSFTENMLQRMKIQEHSVQVSFIRFGDRAKVQLIEEKSEINNIRNLHRMSGAKRLDLAFNLAGKIIYNGNRNNDRKNIVLLVTETNEQDISMLDTVNKYTKQMRLQGIDIYIMLLGNNRSLVDKYLDVPSRSIGEHVFYPSEADIGNWSTTVAKTICRNIH